MKLLYGREKEIKKLRDVIFDDQKSSPKREEENPEPCRWIWITGPRGVGKSALIKHLTTSIEKDDDEKETETTIFWMETELITTTTTTTTTSHHHHHHRKGESEYCGGTTTTTTSSSSSSSSLSSLYPALLQLLEQIKDNLECCLSLKQSPNLGILQSWLPGLQDVIDQGLTTSTTTETETSSSGGEQDSASTTIPKRTEAAISLPPNQQIQIAVKLLLQEVTKTTTSNSSNNNNNKHQNRIVWTVDGLPPHQSVIRDFLTSLLISVENLTIISTATTTESNAILMEEEVFLLQENDATTKDSKSFSSCEIRLDNLTVEDVIQIVPNATQAERLYELSKGNPGLLIALTRPGIMDLLEIDQHDDYGGTLASNHHHQLSIEEIWQKQIQQISTSPQSSELGKLLRIASCLQSPLDLDVLSILMMSNDDTSSEGQQQEIRVLEELLQSGLQAGFFEKRKQQEQSSSSPSEQSSSSYCWRFAHPDLQQMLYLLVVQEECERSSNTIKAIPRVKSRLHYQIGKRLWQKQQQLQLQLQSTTLSSYLQEVVHQLWLGREHCCCSNKDQEHIKVASLCLRLGRSSAHKKSYLEASRYLQQGIEVLTNTTPDKGRSAWRDEYDLCLILHNTAAEVYYCCSEFELVPALVDAVVANARKYEDTLPIRQTYIFALSSQRRHDEATDMGIDILRELKEPIPKKPNYFHAFVALTRTKWLLHGRSDESILSLPSIATSDHPIKLVVMKICNMLMLASYSVRPLLGPILVEKIIRLTILYGQCEISAAVFPNYGMMIASIYRDVESGYRYGQLGLRMYEQQPKNKAWLSRVYVGVYGCISPYKDHIATTFEPLMEAYRCGLTTGDYEMASTAAFICMGNQLDSKYLPQQETDTRAIMNQMLTMGQTSQIGLYRLHLQTVQNFLGKAHGHPSIYKGDFVDAEKELTPELERKEQILYIWMKFYCLLVAYYFCDYDLAAKFGLGLMKDVGEKTTSSNAISYVGAMFYLGISLLASTSGRRRRVSYVRRLLRKIKYYTQYAPMNFLGKFHFLRAELAIITGRHNSVISEFTSAILFSRESGFILEEASENERAGKYCLLREDSEKAKAYLHESLKLYKKSGAIAKVDHLQSEFPHVFNEATDDVPSTVLLKSNEMKARSGQMKAEYPQNAFP